MDSFYKELKSFSEIISNYDVFMFDTDGTIWDGDNNLPDAFKTLNYLKEKGKTIFFITTDTVKTREDIFNKLKVSGFDAQIENIYNSAVISIAFLKSHYPQFKKLYTIGEKGFVEEIKNAGYNVVSSQNQHKLKLSTEEEFQNMPVEDVDAILVSSDMSYNYYKLAYASVCLDKGASLFAANDESFVKHGSRSLPGTGAITSSLEKVINKEATIIGQPNGYGIKLIKDTHNLENKKCLFIGDNIKFDILFGKNGGVDTCLVLTGFTNHDLLVKETNKPDAITPTYVCKDLSL